MTSLPSEYSIGPVKRVEYFTIDAKDLDNPNFIPPNDWFVDEHVSASRSEDLSPEGRLLIWADIVKKEVEFQELKKANRQPIEWR